MKSLSKIAIVAFVGVFGSAAWAASTEITTGQTIGPDGDTGATTTCVLLGERVQVSLSSDVVAAFECEEATSAIDIGTCHTAGQRASRTITCENYAADGETANWNVDGCTTEGDPITVDVSYTGYVASSTGGSVNESPLGGSCNAGELGSLSIFN